MILQQSCLLLFALYQAWVLPVIDAKGRSLGEECVKFDDCGDYPKSALLCLKNVCQCIGSMYYEHSKSMCVSYIGQKCDAVEPTDAIKLEFKCGENARCLPSLTDKFGRCHCKSGYKVNSENKCFSMSNSRLSANANPNHPNHPKHGEFEGSKNSQNPDSVNEVVSFPFSSANYNSQRSSKDSVKSQTFTIVLLLFLSFTLPYIGRVGSLRVN